MEREASKILIVDDEEAILFAFSRVLGGPGREIHSAETLSAALQLLRGNSYRAVIADLKLSGTSNNEGHEVIRAVRSTQKECRIIVMTAYGDEKTKEKVSSMGIDLYLEKPVSPLKVKEMLSSMGIL